MATIVNDTFTGESDGTALNSHTGETGATWTDSFSGSGGIKVLAAGRVYSDGVSVSTHKASGTPGSADYPVSADILPQTQATLFEAGVSGRLIAAGTYYRAAYSTTSAWWTLYQFVGHTPTLLGTYSQALTNGNTYRVTLDMVGTTIRLLVDGVQRISVTDTAVTLAGVAAVYIHQGSPTTGLHVDNFVAGDAPSGGGGVFAPFFYQSLIGRQT